MTATARAPNEERRDLLERYHDGELSPEKMAEVEAMLEDDPSALEYLGQLDMMREVAREANDAIVAGVSFDGLWDGIEATIVEDEAAAEKVKAAARAATRETATERGGFFSWLAVFFGEHKGAFVTAGATAFAVALVLGAFQLFGDNDETGTVQPIVEKHYIHVDSMDKQDPESTVLVNSMEDDGTTVIWLLPNAEDGTTEAADDDDEGVIIEEEPL